MNGHPLQILLVKVPTFTYPDESWSPTYSEKTTIKFTPSYAIAVLGGFLRDYFKVPHQLHVHDMNTVTIGFESSGLSEYELGTQALREVEQTIDETPCDVLLISCQFMFNQGFVDDVVKYAVSRNPNVKIVMGGGFTTIFPRESIEMPHVDWTVVGEGEHTLVHILNRICGVSDPKFEEEWPFDGYGEKLPDGSTRQVPKTAFVKHLEHLPVPSWEYPRLPEYLESSGASVPFMASRGCPMGCSYCSTHLSWGSRVRYRPVDHVIHELAQVIETYGIRDFHCVDDNITINRKWFVRFCDAIAECLPSDLSFHFSNFDMRTLTRDVLRGLKKIGVNDISIATEAGSKEVQKKISRHIRPERIQETIDLIHEEGLAIHNNFMIGFPEETLDQIQETIDVARTLRTESIQIWPMFPFPGTRVYKEGKALGVVNLDLNDYSSLHYRRGNIDTNNWDAATVMQIAYDTSIELNFLNTPYMDTEQGRADLHAKARRVVDQIPGHAIASIVDGYLSMVREGDLDARKEHYQVALEVLQGEDRTFNRYLKWDFPATNDFRSWLEEEYPGVLEQIVAPEAPERATAFITKEAQAVRVTSA